MAFLKRSIWQLRDRPTPQDRVLGLSGEFFCDKDHPERIYILTPLYNWYLPLQPESRTATELGTTPTTRDIALRELVTFYLDTTPSQLYRVSADGQSFLQISGGTGSGITALSQASDYNANLVTPLAARAQVSSTQQAQQTAGATTMLMSADQTKIKDPSGTIDIPLRPTQVYTDAGTARTLTADDLRGAAEATCTVATTYTVPKDPVVTGGHAGMSFFSSGAGATTWTGPSGVAVADNRVTNASAPEGVALLRWKAANTWEVIGVKLA